MVDRNVPVFMRDRFMQENTNDPYARGRQDFVDGKKLKECPYRGRDGNKWRTGWYDQRGETS